MKTPPILIDGARVLEYAEFGESASPALRTAMSAGVPLDAHSLRGLIIAENLVEGGCYLLHCNEQWESLSGEYLPSHQDAREAARSGYEGLAIAWTERTATPEEEREVAIVRQHLREMAEEFRDEG